MIYRSISVESGFDSYFHYGIVRARKIFLLCCMVFCLFSGPVSAQVQLSAEHKKTTDLMTSIAGNVPTIGPYLSIASSLLFTTKSQPNYKQMKREWQSYTNTQIENARLLDLMDGSEGYRSLVSDLKNYGGNNPRNFGLATREPNAALISKWEYIEMTLVKNVGSFKSRRGDKARPLITAYGQLISLHLDSLKTLMFFHANGQKDKNKNTKQYRQYRRSYNKHIRKYEKELFEELGKSADERSADIIHSSSKIIDKKDNSKLKIDARYPVFNQLANHQRRAAGTFWAMYAKMFELSIGELHRGNAKFNKHPLCELARLYCLK